MKINWLVRLKNKNFWISIIPAVLLLVQQIAAMCGHPLDFGELSEQLLAIVNTVFVILAILGIVADPTTQGIKDSERAQKYIKPGKLPEDIDG